MEIFRVEHLDFTYPGETKKVLNDVSFSVNAGEIITLCGASGCGKSTLLRQLKTVLSPFGKKEGKVLFKGKLLSETGEREESEKIGFVSQSADNQIVTDKVYHELAFGLESLSYDTGKIRQRVAEMASFFGIQNWFYKNVNELSGGQKQILSLASIMTMLPEVIILDEPTSQLDPIAASEFVNMLIKINRELGVTILITEHRLDEIIPYSTRVIVMDEGTIIADNAPVNVCLELRKEGHPMLSSMPVSMRIWNEVRDAGDKCPLTVNEGRMWLEEYTVCHGVRQKSEEQNFSNNSENSGHTIKQTYSSDGSGKGRYAAGNQTNCSNQNQIAGLNGSRLERKSDTRFQDKVLELKDIWFKYGKSEKDVLKGVNLSVNRGEIFGILGGNGTGKSTLLSVMSGIRKPYRGKVIADEKIAMLTQNPRNLFVRKTVIQDLKEVCAAENKEKLNEIIQLCRLDRLLQRNPYDLSGGEQQRAAIAKVLLLEPDILLLDEPTKGMDNEYKQELGQLLAQMSDNKTTIIMVSHDIEFCAEWTDRCALFFDGDIISGRETRAFFTNNSFYTTTANRMARNVFPDAVIPQDVIDACNCDNRRSEKEDRAGKEDRTEKEDKIKKEDCTEKRKNESDKIKPDKDDEKNDIYCTEIKMEGIDKSSERIVNNTEEKSNGVKIEKAEIDNVIDKNGIWEIKRGVDKRFLTAAIMILIAIPFTIFTGVYYFDDRKFLFISLVVLLECIAPFFILYEGRNPGARELVMISVLCAISVAGRMAFYMFPQFKPVMALVIISGVSLGAETGFLVGAITMLVSNIVFEQGPWTPWQMFAMGMVGFLAGIIFHRRKKVFNYESIVGKIILSIYGFIAAVIIYGGIMNPAAAIMAHAKLNKATLLSYYATGFPMDAIQGVATVLFILLLAQPVMDKIERVKHKYGLGLKEIKNQ